MALRALRGWRMLLGSWVVVLSSGCTEGDDPKLPDAGRRRDAGEVDASEEEEEELDASEEPLDSGTLDAAREASVSATATCGMPPKTCTAHVITSVGELAPGCALNYQDAEVCGISSQHVLLGEAPKFLEKNAKGVASPSCGAFYDALEGADAGARDAGGAGNGRIDKNVSITLMGVPTTLRISYPGCCTEKGFCSADGNKGMSEYGASMSGFGCMESTAFFRYLPDIGPAGSAGAGHALRAIPCDRDSGMIALPDLDAGAADAGDSAAQDAASDAGQDGGDGG